ncbi:MAG TPA: nuclear transport factor 2 family protein, partial [Acidimicrobiales bacterium]|nr:nuclear transport factor 2 family protein [Acidimicrobiales bacterium]
GDRSAASQPFPNARELGIRSRAAVEAGDREAWLDMFTDDAVVQDPVGPSAFDPEGKGHRGRNAIARFYDTVIAPNEAISFEVERSYLCGDEVADVGVIRTTLPGGTHMAVVRRLHLPDRRLGQAHRASGLLGVRSDRTGRDLIGTGSEGTDLRRPGSVWSAATDDHPDGTVWSW